MGPFRGMRMGWIWGRIRAESVDSSRRAVWAGQRSESPAVLVWPLPSPWPRPGPHPCMSGPQHNSNSTAEVRRKNNGGNRERRRQTKKRKEKNKRLVSDNSRHRRTLQLVHGVYWWNRGEQRSGAGKKEKRRTVSHCAADGNRHWLQQRRVPKRRVLSGGAEGRSPGVKGGKGRQSVGARPREGGKSTRGSFFVIAHATAAVLGLWHFPPAEKPGGKKRNKWVFT